MTSGTDPRIAHLTELFSELPGLGPRSASRLVADLLTARNRLRIPSHASDGGVPVIPFARKTFVRFAPSPTETAR